MIGLLCPFPRKEAGNLVLAALRRSVSAIQAGSISPAALQAGDITSLCAVEPDAGMGEQLWSWLQQGTRKLILFGALPDNLAAKLGFTAAQWPDATERWAHSAPAPTYATADSPASIRYTELSRMLDGKSWQRALERFDFTDEWNNLGFGAIRMDHSIWSLAQPLQAPAAHELAGLCINGSMYGSYAALFDLPQASILWFNRPVGHIDSFEWRLVESFIASHRHHDLPCHPVLREIPHGHDAAITMRLDCDEDIESARPLWQTYRELGVPFSLAIHTHNLNDRRHDAILHELVASGGCLLSHTATHAPNWGGSYEAARQEGTTSATRIQEVSGVQVRYAVSPFHQSPPYALAGLADAGYHGCIGGIIRNDPEFLLARGGTLHDLPQSFIGHSQQCMLHGDCMLKEGDPLAIYKQAFDLAYETNTLFGFLDHPFSTRYQYGWCDENSRIDAHRNFISYIRSKSSNPTFLNENDALDFIRLKSEANIISTNSGFILEINNQNLSKHNLSIEFHGNKINAIAGKLL